MTGRLKPAPTFSVPYMLASRDLYVTSDDIHCRLMRTVLTLLLFLTASASFATDPVEGKWLGTVGDDGDRVASGLEIKSRPNGDLIALVTQPVVNFYNLPARVTRDGGKYVIADLGA